MKANEPGKFAGKDVEDFKGWAKTVRAWCNVRRRGLRLAMEWAEIQPQELNTPQALSQIASGVPNTLEVDVELYELLAMITTGDALVLIERTKEKGFDAWRRLHA